VNALGQVVFLSLPFLFLLARKPVLRRLAFRNATRRPRETMLVLLGSLLGTAIITGSLIVGDTLDRSFRQAVYSHQGPIDELVETSAVPQAEIERRLAAVGSDDVDGLLPITTAAAAVIAGDKAEPNATIVEVDFARAAAFGADPDSTGIEGPTPAPGRVVITEDLAEMVDVDAGDRVVVAAYGKRLDVTVDRVVERKGIAGFRLSPGSEAFNVVVGPGTIASLTAGGPPGATLPNTYVAVSNTGGVVDGAALTDTVVRQLRPALEGVPAGIIEVKQDTLEYSELQGKQFTELFVGIGFFSVLAGILLLVNIFVMLAQERKTELGMLRAVGMRRASLVGGFSLEGWLYALASSALGMVAGLGVGRLIVVVASSIFSNPGEIFSLELQYAATLESALAGFAGGFTMSLLVVVTTSVWIARLNVIRAIRDLPDPPRSRTQQVLGLAVGAVLTALGGVLAVAGIGGEVPSLVLIGPALLAVGVVLLLRRLVPFRPLVTAASAVVIVFSITAFDLFPDAFETAEIPVFVVMGVILNAAAVILVSFNQRRIGSFVRRIGGGSENMPLRLGLAYPLAKLFRTGMILSMYALVVFTLVFMTVFSHLFAQQVESFTQKVSGGFDVRVDSNPTSPIPVEAAAAMPGVAGVAPITNALAEFEPRCPKCPKDFVDWPAGTFDRRLIDAGPPAIAERPPGLRDDRAVYEALLRDPNAIVPTQFFLQEGGGPPTWTAELGDLVVIRNPETGATRELRVLALAESGFGNLTAMVAPQTMQELFGPTRSSPNTLFVTAAAGVDVDELATSINGRFIESGSDARSFRSIVELNLGQQKQFFRLIQGYLALGLVVGIAGLGVVMVRSVRERRREVGVLRSLGFEAGAVRKAFIAESAFVALEGIVIGTALALVTSWRLVGNETFGATLKFAVPLGSLAVLTIGTFVASLIATAAPAQQASRIKPAVALRIAD